MIQPLTGIIAPNRPKCDLKRLRTSTFGFRGPNDAFDLGTSKRRMMTQINLGISMSWALLEQAVFSGSMIAWGLVAFLVYHVYQLARDPLRGLPGPWLARYTRLWELRELHEGNFE